MKQFCNDNLEEVKCVRGSLNGKIITVTKDLCEFTKIGLENLMQEYCSDKIEKMNPEDVYVHSNLKINGMRIFRLTF